MTYEIKYRREDEMRNSGIEWLGMIPKDFVLKSLKFSYKFSTGSTPSSGDDSYYSEDGYRWVNISDIKDKYIRDTTNYISDKAIKNINIKLNKKGSLVYSFKLSVGQVAFLEDDMYTNEAIATFDISNKNRLDFLYYMAPIFIIRNANENIYGAKLLNQNLINNAKILIPNLDTQQKIANFLDLKTSEFDSIISKRELLIEKLEEAKKSLISEVVTGKVKIVDGELVEREPDEMKDSGVQWLGMIPKDWNLMKIKDVTKIFRGRFNHRPRNDFKLYENGTYPFIQTGDVAKANKYLVKYTQTLNKVGAKVSIKFPIGTLIMTIAANIGDLAIAKIGAFYPDSIVGFYPKIRELNSEYLYLLFSSMKEEFLRNSIVNTQANLNIERVGNIKITIGSKTEIDLVVKYLNAKMKDLNSIITKTKLQIQKLKQAKQSLISECVTGKIDLRDWEIQ